MFVLNEEQDDDEGGIETTYTGKNLEKCMNVEVPSEKNCNDIDLDNNYGCCYLSGKDEDKDYKYCVPYNESEVKALLASFEEEKGNLSIKCPEFNTNNTNTKEEKGKTDSSDDGSDSSSKYIISKALIIILSLLF